MIFNEFKLSEPILRAVRTMSFAEPTPVQEQAIPAALQGRDILGTAQTGTGKTAAFGLPLLMQIDVDEKNTQALVLCPTRELCVQVAKDLTSFGKYMPGLSVTAVIESPAHPCAMRRTSALIILCVLQTYRSGAKLRGTACPTLLVPLKSD